MKNKKYIVGIVILIIIAIVLLIGNLVKTKKTNHMPVSIDGKTAEGQLLFNGVGVFSEKYTGYMSRSDITDRFTMMITEEFPEMYDELRNKDKNETQNYYESNKTELKEKYGFENASEFAKMVDVLKNKEIDLKNYYKLSVDTNSFSDNSDKANYSSAKCEVSYSDGSVIRFFAYISKKKSNMPHFIIRIEE